MRGIMIFAIGVFAAGLFGAPRARAGEGGAAEATKLRDASAKDWNEGHFREGADKLRRAAAIYERTPERFVAELGTVRRALVWNLVKAGDLQATKEPFVALLTVYASDKSVRPDVWSAYQALYEAAKAAEGAAGARNVLDPVRDAAHAAQAPDIAAQVLHDLGSITRDHGDRDTAAAYFKSAIVERHTIEDRLGEAWSLNNLANLYLVRGAGADEWKFALAPLLSAQRLVIDERLGAPAQAVATNLRTVLSRLSGVQTPDESTAVWLWDLARTSIDSDAPTVIPPDFLLRRATEVRVARSDSDAMRLDIARELVSTADNMTKAPTEVRADLLLLAATLATESGGAKEADSCLRLLDVGQGPAAPHLAARAAVERVRWARAGGAKAKEVADWITAARKRLLDLRDRPLRLASLPILGEAAKAAGLAELVKELEKEAADAGRDGADGGRGGSARGAGDRARFSRLGVLDVVFEIRFDEGKLAIRDTLIDAAPVTVDVVWQPVNVSVDGLALTVFGGYVVVRNLDYAGASVATGSESGATLEGLETYLPVPATGALRIHVNGAASYGK